jgi:excisionase family DNA binding protein
MGSSKSFSLISWCMTEQEAAARLRISEDELRAEVEQGRLTAARVGGHLRFTERDLAGFARRAGSLGPRAPRRVAWAIAGSILLVATVAWAVPWSEIIPGATPLYSFMNFSSSPPQHLPPLDPGVGFYRTLTADESSHAGTSQNLGLYMEDLACTPQSTPSCTSQRSPWPLYVELNTNHMQGDGVPIYARLRTAGSGWGAGVHSEAIISGPSTSIGFNAEMSKKQDSGGRSIGLNLLAKARYQGQVNEASDEAINIQTDPDSRWNTGIHFDSSKVYTGIHFDASSSGNRAIWVEGNYAVGVDLGSTSLRMNAGTAIQLENTGQITISFNPTAQRIEFKAGDRLLGYISALNDASGGKIN